MSGIAELFELRRSTGLSPEQERLLFQTLREELLPRLARGQAERGEGPPAKRKASGLPDSVEDYWHDLMTKIHKDPFWPGKGSQAVVTLAYLATCFRRYLDDMRRQERSKPAILFVGGDEFDDSEHGHDDDVEREPFNVIVDAAEHAHLGSDERSTLSRKYLRLARDLLDANRRLRWLPRLIELQLEPIFLEGIDPILKMSAAESMGIAPATITKYVQTFGLASPPGRSTAGWSKTILGNWVTLHCGITDPRAEPEKVLLALHALCRRNYELRRRMTDHA